MPIVYLAPDPVQSTFFIPGSNTPGNGVQLFCYVALSVSTKQNMYTDNTGNTAYSNPLVLDSGGNIPNGGVIWIPQGLPAKFVWAPSNDGDPPTSPYRTIDNVSGINDITSNEWATGPTPTFVNSSSFTVSGDQTATLNKGRRLKFAVTAGTVYGSVALAAFATGSTTVNTVHASGSLDAGLTALSYSLIGVEPSSINDYYIHKKAPAVPSAGNGTTNIWGTDGDFIHVTGTNAINSFSTAPYAGAERTVIFDGALSLNNNANLLVPGAVNVTTAANDRIKVRADATSTAIVVQYTKASGMSVSSASGLTFISSSQAASSASLDFANLTGFGSYLAVLKNITPSSNTANLWMRMSTSNGASFDTTAAYEFIAVNQPIGGVLGTLSSTAATHMIVVNSISNIAGHGVNGNVNFGLNAAVNTYSGTPGYRQGVGNSTYAASFSAGRFTNGSANAVQFLADSGTINAGVIYMYGLRSNGI